MAERDKASGDHEENAASHLREEYNHSFGDAGLVLLMAIHGKTFAPTGIHLESREKLMRDSLGCFLHVGGCYHNIGVGELTQGKYA